MAIARAGQERTLSKCTYFHGMRELLDIVERVPKCAPAR